MTVLIIFNLSSFFLILLFDFFRSRFEDFSSLFIGFYIILEVILALYNYLIIFVRLLLASLHKICKIVSDFIVSFQVAGVAFK